MTRWIMLFANGRPPAVGGSDIDHCTDFELAPRQAPQRAVGGHVAKRDDFRWLGHRGGRGCGVDDGRDTLFEKHRPNLSAYMHRRCPSPIRGAPEIRGAFPGLAHDAQNDLVEEFLAV